MIEIKMGVDKVLFSWDTISNRYDEELILFNDMFINDFYINNINNGFYISFNGLKFISQSNNIIGTYINPENKEYGSNILNNIRATYNVESYMTSSNMDYEFNCSSEPELPKT